MNREEQLARILEGWLDGGLDEAEQAALLDALASDPALRRDLAAQLAMLGLLRAMNDENPRWLALFDMLEAQGPDEKGGDQLEEATMAEIARIGHPPRNSWLLAAAAGLALLLVASAYFITRELAPSGDRGVATPDPAPAPPIMMVMAAKGSALETGAYLTPGSLEMEEGWMSLQTLHGVTITLDAPFAVDLLAHDEILLTHGRARVHVPPGAEGFRVYSPNFKILDLGTEFAAEVERNGAGRCRVFEGKADVSLVDALRVPTVTRRLNAAESIRIEPSRQDMETIQEQDTDYPEIKLPPRPLLALASGYPDLVRRIGPEAYWRFEATSETGQMRDEAVPGGRLLAMVGSASLTPEAGGNHSGRLVCSNEMGYFGVEGRIKSVFDDDWSIAFFAQFDWVQNYALISTLEFVPDPMGHPFLLQASSAFGQSGLDGTGLHAVAREPAAWTGGTQVFGDRLLRPRFWHHIAATCKDGELTLYQDGRPVGHGSIGDSRLDFDYFYVGRLNANPKHQWKSARSMAGGLDELAIFGRALKASEVRRLAAGKVEARP